MKRNKLPVFEGNPRMAKNLFIPDAVRPGELRVYNPKHVSNQTCGLPPLPAGFLFVQFTNGLRTVLGPSFDVEVHDLRERACDLINRKTSYNPNSRLFRRAKAFQELIPSERISRMHTENFAFGIEVEFKCRVTWFVCTLVALREFVSANVHIGSMHRITSEGVQIGEREWFRLKLNQLRNSDEDIGRKPRRKRALDKR